MKGILMTSVVSDIGRAVGRLGVPACLVFASLLATTASAKTVMIAKWARFEESFKSSVHYSNPPQECELRVTFTSPHGETNTVFGFWDGAKTWRVRFSPDFPGHWTY